MLTKMTIPKTECIVLQKVFYPTNEITGIPIEEVKKTVHF